MGDWNNGAVVTLDLTHVVFLMLVDFSEVDLFFSLLFFLLELPLKLELFLF